MERIRRYFAARTLATMIGPSLRADQASSSSAAKIQFAPDAAISARPNRQHEQTSADRRRRHQRKTRLRWHHRMKT